MVTVKSDGTSHKQRVHLEIDCESKLLKKGVHGSGSYAIAGGPRNSWKKQGDEKYV